MIPTKIVSYIDKSVVNEIQMYYTIWMVIVINLLV